MIKNSGSSFNFRRVLFVVSLLSVLLTASNIFAAGNIIKKTDNAVDKREILIKLLHTNDMHSNLNGFVTPAPTGGTEEVAGISRIASFFKNARQKEPNTICLSAGDSFQGTLFFNFFKGAAEIATMNSSGYDIMCPGNHEFDEGSEWFFKVMKPAAFDLINCNLEFDPALHPEAASKISPYVIKEIDRVKIAFTATIAKDLENLVGPKALKGVKVLDPAEALEKLIPELRKKADIVILMSHNGYDADTKLAASVSGIDAIIGGHSHTKLEKAVIVNNPESKPVIICQAGEKGEFIGELNLGFCFATRTLRLIDCKLDRMDSTVVKDADTQKIVDRYGAEISQQVMIVIGNAVKTLVGERANVRGEETNLGDFLADMILKHSKADMAVINGGSIRASILKGDIKIADCINSFPFNQGMTVLKIKGKHIKSAFDYVAKMSAGKIHANYKNERQMRTVVYADGRFAEIMEPAETHNNKILAGKFGGFLQVSKGMRVIFKNGTVEELSLNGAALEDEKIYTFATSDFTAGGGDGFAMFNEAEEKLTSGNLTELFVEVVRSMKIIDVDVEGRIKN